MPEAPYSFRLNPDYDTEREVKEYLDGWLDQDSKLPKEQQLGLRGILTQIISSYMEGNPRPIISRQEYRLERAITAQVNDLREEMREYFVDLENRLKNAVISGQSAESESANESEGEPLDEKFVDSIIDDFERHRRKNRRKE